MMTVSLARPWLRCDLGRMRRVLSWSLNRPGFVEARHILWREVRDADLTADLDTGRWFAAELARRGDAEAVGLLTSRDIGTWREAAADVEGIRAQAVVTAGLSNAERVGRRRPAPDSETSGYGTINIAVAVSEGLTEGAMVEALSIATQARTAAVLEAGLTLLTGTATGTGTDCIALAADPGETRHAGLHTPVGEVLGRVVMEATAAAIADWMALS
ncbi:adenosylcobinamide amidohydrolase [Haematobacter massiliensis]|uniref:Adenosylcobinamide amidohydrolase n=2 Tax=Haematobacter massiliensis TaxID=195105 RepID=A0A086Y030_9RHOB|nr:adenosylcobinamide amidohydrolase [Haematobacter massiliensis]